MEPIRRVVVHDRHPWLEPELLRYRSNRLVLLAAVLSLLGQIRAWVDVALGMGVTVQIFDRVLFTAVPLLWLLLGVLVFLQRRAGRAARLFLLFASAGSLFLAYGTLYPAGYVEALCFSAGLLFFPPLLVSFAGAYGGDPRWRREELLLYVPPLILLLPSASALNAHVTTLVWKIALLSVGVYLVLAVVQAARNLAGATTPTEAAQFRALLFGLVAGTVPGILVFIVPVEVTNSFAAALIHWMPLVVLLFLVSMCWAVLLFEFSEADLIVRRGVVYGAMTLAIVAAYAILGIILIASHVSVISPGGGFGFVVVAVLIGAAFTPVTRASRRLVDWLLYGRRVDRWELLQALSARLAIVMQEWELEDLLVRDLTDALHLRGAFVLRRGEDGTFAVDSRSVDARRERADGRGEPASLDERTLRAALGDPPRPLLLVHARPLTRARFVETPGRFRPLDAVGAALSIPLVTRSGLQAVLCLQQKISHDAFDADDLELLAPVMRQAAAALDNALLFSRLEQKIEELRVAYMRIAREQERERARLSRELHDGTAQELAGLMTLATVVERQLEGDEGAARKTLETLRSRAQDAYQGVRRASHALRPIMLDDFGLGPTLQRYLAEFHERTGIAVDTELGEVGELSDDVELALFRVVQECMENVRKHSGAGEAALRLVRADGHIVLRVSDRGRGMPAAASRGVGLAGMRERVEAVGGTMLVRGGPGHGVEVEATIPVGEGD